MKFNLWTQYGAKNSEPVFNAFCSGAKSLGHDVVFNSDGDGIDVIWSVLFHGRMAGNQAIWKRALAQSKPVVVLEVGGIKRGTTWKVGVNGINRDAYFGDDMGDDNSRTAAFNLSLKPWRTDGEYILICGQHDKSLQWHGMPRMSNWFLQTYDNIRKHTDRPILFRPHPRCRLPEIERGLKYVERQEPRHIDGTYDDFDIEFRNIHCTISYSSNPGIHSIIAGVPAFVSTHSLAYPVANDIDFLHDIEKPIMPDRQQWLNNYAWTEYTVEEIQSGFPIKRLTNSKYFVNI